jgi:uncharacterized protein involved in exopolysaccharide biosynthesis
MLQTVDDRAKGEPGDPHRTRSEAGRPLPVPAPQPVEQEQHVIDVLRVLYRQRWMILTVAIAGALLAIAVGLSIAPRYTAVAEIAVEPSPRSAVGGRAVSAEDEMIIDTHIARLSSRDQMARVLDSLYPSEPASAEPQAAPAAEAEEPVGPGLSERVAGIAEELARRLKLWSGFGEKRGTELSLRQLERDAKIVQARRSRLISVAFTSTSPQQAASVANRIAELYVEARNLQKQDWLRAELARVGERIGGLRDEAQNARAAAQTLVILLRRQDELRAEIEFVSPDISISSVAKAPERPSSSNPLLFILPAALICAIGACAFAVIRSRLDHALRSERKVSDALGLPCIGLVPKTARMAAERRIHGLLEEPFSPYAEAIRAIAATLRVVAGAPRADVVLITSSVPQEGRSTLALSLATFLSNLGRRVLLVDLDARPGTYLAALPSSAFDYRPVQRNRIDPVLFAGDHLPRLIRQWRDEYDCVVIDGPPLLGAAEARLLPALADKVLFAVKWGDTRREVAQSGIRLLQAAGGPSQEWAETTTAVLTQVDARRHAQYRFGDAGELTLRFRRYYAHAIKAWRSPPPADAAAE